MRIKGATRTLRILSWTARSPLQRNNSNSRLRKKSKTLLSYLNTLKPGRDRTIRCLHRRKMSFKLQCSNTIIPSHNNSPPINSKLLSLCRSTSNTPHKICSTQHTIIPGNLWGIGNPNKPKEISNSSTITVAPHIQLQITFCLMQQMILLWQIHNTSATHKLSITIRATTTIRTTLSTAACYPCRSTMRMILHLLDIRFINLS